MQLRVEALTVTISLARGQAVEGGVQFIDTLYLILQLNVPGSPPARRFLSPVKIVKNGKKF